MAYTITKNDSLQIIELIYEGYVSGKELQKGSDERIALSLKENITLGIVDLSNSTSDASLLSVHDIPDVVFEEQDQDPNTKTALIRPKSTHDYEMAEYFVAAARNRGWNIHMFANRAEALAWLIAN